MGPASVPIHKLTHYLFPVTLSLITSYQPRETFGRGKVRPRTHRLSTHRSSPERTDLSTAECGNQCAYRSELKDSDHRHRTAPIAENHQRQDRHDNAR